jgi:predicted dehydrogenase
MTMKQLKLLIIGAGSRGNAYARAITTSPKASVYAVAEPDTYKRQIFGKRYI